MPAAGAHLHLVTDADRIVTRLTLDNIVSDADHVMATHNPLDQSAIPRIFAPPMSTQIRHAIEGAEHRWQSGMHRSAIPRWLTAFWTGVRSHNVVRIAHDVI